MPKNIPTEYLQHRKFKHQKLFDYDTTNCIMTIHCLINYRIQRICLKIFKVELHDIQMNLDLSKKFRMEIAIRNNQQLKR